MNIKRCSILLWCIPIILLISCLSGSKAKKSDNPHVESENTTSVENSTDADTAITKNQALADSNTTSNIQGKDFNFKFIGYDINIDDPAWDRRSYYKIFIDKVDTGRTTIALESQKKSFEYKISNDRHLLIIEKWALDEKKGQYVKLNNIEQPRPGYLYFELPENKTTVIILKNDPVNNKSEFLVEFE